MPTPVPPLAFPFEIPAPLEPPPEFARLREGEPVARVRFPTGDHGWLVTRYEDVRLVLGDARFSRAAATAPGAPRLRPIPPDATSILAMDPPDHTRLRKLVVRAFTARRVEQLRPHVQEVTDALLDGLAQAGPPADLVPAFAQPLPITVICELLGVPYAERGAFRTWSDKILSLTAHSAEEVRQARAGLGGYLRQLIETKRRTPADDLLSALVAAHDHDDRLTEDEVVTFGSTLLVAGYETTANAISGAVLRLLRHPDQLGLLRAEPHRLPAAVEELLRYNPLGVNGGTIRVATEDVRLGGVLIRAGEAVLPAINAGNRDRAVFDAPDRFDVSRADNPHLAFGFGVHHCLGAQLARMELQVALGSLLRRFPALALAAPGSELEMQTGMVISGLTALPVTW